MVLIKAFGFNWYARLDLGLKPREGAYRRFGTVLYYVGLYVCMIM